MLDKFDWIVVPGGPGLSKLYLQQALVNSFSSDQLHYYDPYGAPESTELTTPKLNEMVDQIFEVAHDRKLHNYGLITHSFGNYLAIRALERADHNISSVLMISPMPFQFSIWAKALEEIIATVPESVLKKIDSLSKSPGNGSEIFRIIFPYYAIKKEVDIPIVPFDMNMCNEISAQVPDYDHRRFILECQIPLVVVVGDGDIFFKDKECLSDRTIVVPGVGHYPFFEDKVGFFNAIKKGKKILCQQILARIKKSF